MSLFTELFLLPNRGQAKPGLQIDRLYEGSAELVARQSPFDHSPFTMMTFPCSGTCHCIARRWQGSRSP